MRKSLVNSKIFRTFALQNKYGGIKQTIASGKIGYAAMSEANMPMLEYQDWGKPLFFEILRVGQNIVKFLRRLMVVTHE